MSNEDLYVHEASHAIYDVLKKLVPELEADALGDVAFEIASHLDASRMLLGGYRRGSY
jgi:hypothetical protein